MYKPDTRPISTDTGYLIRIKNQLNELLLDLKKHENGIKAICKLMEKQEPWYDKEYRKSKHIKK